MLKGYAMRERHALVCGGSQGIGQACAIELARQGAKVTILARNPESLAKTLGQLQEFGSGHRAVRADLADPLQRQQALEQIGTQVDILICNSGGPLPGALESASIQDMQLAFEQHVVANHFLVQALSPHMKKQRFGRIISIISTSVKIPLPGLGISNTVRGAAASWSKTLASELGPYGITVNNILPGFTRTQRLEQIVETKMQKTGADRQAVETSMLKDVPVGRFAEPSELAAACVFLASEQAAYINGINLPVDGGRTGCL